MASARDLLQQADALMRSNRSVGGSRTDEAVPVLTDVAVPAGSPLRLGNDDIPVLTSVMGVPAEAIYDLAIPAERVIDRRFPDTQMESLLPLSEMPAMPHMEENDSIIASRRNDSQIERRSEDDTLAREMPKWLDANLLDTDSTLRPPAAIAPLSIDPETRQPTRAHWYADPKPEPHASTSYAPEAPSAMIETYAVESRPSAEEVAETVYFQVLQNLDLYTERALQERLTTHLQPIIERASQELLATLNANLGELMRQYVAEAIEKQLGVRPATYTPAHKG